MLDGRRLDISSELVVDRPIIYERSIDFKLSSDVIDRAIMSRNSVELREYKCSVYKLFYGFIYIYIDYIETDE